MKLYRAVPTQGLDETRIYKRHATPRLPSNVPYVVDNLWELMRPDTMPCRRFAVYASTSPELALKNASHSTQNTVCELEFSAPSSCRQLSVTDARYHPSIKAVQAYIHNYFYQSGLPSELSFMFVPGVTKQYFQKELENPSVDFFVSPLKLILERIDIWSEPSSLDGELFFELREDVSYTLKRI